MWYGKCQLRGASTISNSSFHISHFAFVPRARKQLAQRVVEVFPLQLVLPNANNLPSVLPQKPVLFSVPLFVPLDLRQPPLPPGRRDLRPSRMPVPKVPVHKHRNLPRGKNKVRTNQERRTKEPQLLVAPPSCDPLAAKDPDHRQLGRFVPRRTDQRHHLRPLGFREDVRHRRARHSRRRSGNGARFRPPRARSSGRRAWPTARRRGKALRLKVPPPRPDATPRRQSVSARAAIRSPRPRNRRDAGRERRRRRRTMRGGNRAWELRISSKCVDCF